MRKSWVVSGNEHRGKACGCFWSAGAGVGRGVRRGGVARRHRALGMRKSGKQILTSWSMMQQLRRLSCTPRNS
jgi:hypothetical protein